MASRTNGRGLTSNSPSPFNKKVKTNKEDNVQVTLDKSDQGTHNCSICKLEVDELSIKI